MRPQNTGVAALGATSIIVGVALIATREGLAGLVPLLLGLSLIYLGYRPGRASLVFFGHACVVTGCALVTWGLYLLPHCQPTLLHVVGRPLFWGLFSIFGGICAIQHGYCRCISADPCGKACSGRDDD